MKNEVNELETIEALAEKNNINESALAGIKILNDWRSGKKVTEKEFKQAVDKFKKVEI